MLSYAKALFSFSLKLVRPVHLPDSLVPSLSLLKRPVMSSAGLDAETTLAPLRKAVQEQVRMSSDAR